MLDDVLRFIDDNLPASLDRLFSLLRIESISTDPAYREGCRAAADWVVATLSELGFAAVAHPTPGHPIVLARADGAFTATTTSSPSTRSTCGRRRRSRRAW
jgi:acetylornithine deacetylase/succinyl-diaminopimelate desuccinylase-like protein